MSSGSCTLVGMDLSTPLRSLAPSLESAVLTVLAGTEASLSASAIARLAQHGTRNGQAPVLARLVEHGVVATSPGTTGPLYRLNREHLLAPAVLLAVGSRQVLLDRLRTALGELEPTLVHASLFGSFARHEGDPSSDIDLLLVTTDDRPGDWHDRIVELADHVRAWTGNPLETVVLTREHLARTAGSEPVVDAWLAEGVTVHGPELADLLASIAADA